MLSMTVDEYETIRLIDLESLTQEECALRMGVARTTVQATYEKARRKLAECIVEGIQLVIDGGNYEICGRKRPCGKTCCRLFDADFPELRELN